MSVDGWNTVLVLGGIRSGKSAFAESLVGATRRRSGTSPPPPRRPRTTRSGRARIAAHRERRPRAWTTEETGADPAG